jgi:hypothetical protein
MNQMAEQVELQACEHCSKELPVETMEIMDDCWFCSGCTAEWRAIFDACEHRWEPHVDQMGDEGQYCTRCMGFVCNEDMPVLFPKS